MLCRVLHLYAPYANILHQCLEIPLVGLVMQSWNLQQQDFHQLISLLRVAMGQFIEGFYLMVRLWL
jgi:hypothetical protein